MSVQILQGDCREILPTLPAESIDCCVTSPPYWGLRDYGVDCQIGLEATPEKFVEQLVAVFREVRRALKPAGTLWVNMGDAYNNCDKWGGGGANTGKHTRTPNGEVASWKAVRRKWSKLEGIKPKDLIGQPWMLAFALRKDGWYLRSEIIWNKPNPMPESVRDRPTKAHETIFLLSKSPRYFYDAEAIKQPAKWPDCPNSPQSIRSPHGQGFTRRASDKQRGHSRRHAGFNDHWDNLTKAEQTVLGANARSVWTIATQPYPEAHFATFPQELAKRCILAGCPARTCGACGAPYEVATEVSYTNPGNRSTNGPRSIDRKHQQHGSAGFSQRLERVVERGEPKPTCACGAASVAATVLDPFAGSGTVGQVAQDLGHRAVLIEANPDYIAMIERRCAQTSLLATEPTR